MVTYTHRTCGMIAVISLLWVSVCYSIDTKIETTNSINPVVAPNIPGDSSTMVSSGGRTNPAKSRGFIGKIEDNIHEDIREERIEALLEINKERIATLSEIDKERLATLAYLTRERLAATEDLKIELKRITKIIMSERRATTIELEEISNQIVKTVLLKSELLIDHFFVRMLQLTTLMILSVCILVFLFFLIREQRKNRS